jgi:hypothetical protein
MILTPSYAGSSRMARIIPRTPPTTASAAPAIITNNPSQAFSPMSPLASSIQSWSIHASHTARHPGVSRAPPGDRRHAVSAATRSTIARQSSGTAEGSSVNCDGLMQIVR